MINRIFLLSEQTYSEEPEENIYYVIIANPLTQGSLDNAYQSIANTPVQALGLALEVKAPLPDAAIRLAAAACFLPSCLRIDGQPLILLTGASPQLLEQASSSLKAYLGLQGLGDCQIHRLSLSGLEPRQPGHDTVQLFESPQSLARHYTAMLTGDRYDGNDLFFYSSSPETLQTALTMLRQIDNKFVQDFPALAGLIQANQHLEGQIRSLQKQLDSIRTELAHQKQYVEVLRSSHATKELQDYYTNEYEILPLWFKRLGHLVKVLTGKRTFRSLFRDDVKKYKD